jgi:hypothetical protein
MVSWVGGPTSGGSFREEPLERDAIRSVLLSEQIGACRKAMESDDGELRAARLEQARRILRALARHFGVKLMDWEEAWRIAEGAPASGRGLIHPTS